jgi:hypothetical protein
MKKKIKIPEILYDKYGGKHTLIKIDRFGTPVYQDEKGQRKSVNVWYLKKAIKISRQVKKRLGGFMAQNYTAQELAESYVNGNISYVRKAVGRNLKLFIQVFDELFTYVSKEKAFAFMRMIYSGL